MHFTQDRNWVFFGLIQIALSLETYDLIWNYQILVSNSSVGMLPLKFFSLPGFPEISHYSGTIISLHCFYFVGSDDVLQKFPCFYHVCVDD